MSVFEQQTHKDPLKTTTTIKVHVQSLGDAKTALEKEIAETNLQIYLLGEIKHKEEIGRLQDTLKRLRDYRTLYLFV